MRLMDKIRDYKLRHLCIGRVKNLNKKNPSVFRIEKISWDVHWQTNLYLAVIIRDYLRFFIKNTPAIGNCVFEDPYAVRLGMDEEQNDHYSKKWNDLVNSVANEFDELIKIMIMDNREIQDHPEFNRYEKEKALTRKAFSDLAEIFYELGW